MKKKDKIVINAYLQNIDDNLIGTIQDIVNEMTHLGYKITPRMVRSYIEYDLLSKPEKRGGYGKGVKLVFSNKPWIVLRLKRIYELKAKGLTLEEIGIVLEEEDKKKSIKDRQKHFKRFVERDGKCYFRIGSSAFDKTDPIIITMNENQELFRFRIADSISKYCRDRAGRHSLFRDDFFNSISESYPKENSFWDDVSQIEKHSLFQPLYIFRNKFVYMDERDDYEIGRWYQLRRQYGIGWETLKSLQKKHQENLQRYVFFPEPDGERFTKKWVKWHKQKEMNAFGDLLFGYLNTERDQLVYIHRAFSEPVFSWDSFYSDVGRLVDDFLQGRCAFVPIFGNDPYGAKFFLKRLGRD